MAILSKVFFFLTFFVSVIFCIILMLLSLDHWLHPFKKDSEAIILLTGSFVTMTGMYVGVKYGYYAQDLPKGFFLLTGSWIAATIVIAIGLVFFNGSSK